MNELNESIETPEITRLAQQVSIEEHEAYLWTLSDGDILRELSCNLAPSRSEYWTGKNTLWICNTLPSYSKRLQDRILPRLRIFLDEYIIPPATVLPFDNSFVDDGKEPCAVRFMLMHFIAHLWDDEDAAQYYPTFADWLYREE